MPYVLLVDLDRAGGRDRPRRQHEADHRHRRVRAVRPLWMLWWITLHPAWETRGRPDGGVLRRADGADRGAVLVVNDPVFGFFSWTGYIWIYRVLHGNWRIAGSSRWPRSPEPPSTAGLRPAPRASWIGWVAIVALNCFVAGGDLLVRPGSAMSSTTCGSQAIEELTEANAKLEASMRENAGLHEQLLARAREAGVLDERQRMAREIHDTLAQGLVGIITQLEAAADRRRRGLAAPHRRRARPGTGEPRRGAPLGPGARPGRARPGPAGRSADGTVASKWSAPQWRGRDHDHDRNAASRCARRSRSRCCAPPRRRSRTSPSTRAPARVALTLSYMDDVVSLDVRDDGVGFDRRVPIHVRRWRLRADRDAPARRGTERDAGGGV